MEPARLNPPALAPYPLDNWVSRRTVNETVKERRPVTTEMALQLARFFNDTVEFWLKMQQPVDVWKH